MGAVEVVAALVWDNDKFMICKRPEHKTRGGLWEFVGGKVENGESKQAALIRECREELDIDIEVGELFMEEFHEYADITVHLSIYTSKIISGEPKLLEHSDIAWLYPSEAYEYEFCPADIRILERIKLMYG